MSSEDPSDRPAAGPDLQEDYVLHHRVRLALAVAVMAALGVAHGCTSQFSGTTTDNRRPTVWLSAAPPEGSTSGYTIQFYWGGFDPDGEVSHYEYVITNNKTGVFDPADTTGTDKWRRVFANESTFVVSADLLADSSTTDFETLRPVEFERPHTFFIRAVDEMGLASVPEYRSFTSTTLSPTVDILVPRGLGLTPAAIPPIATFRWVAKDAVDGTIQSQDPDSVRWVLVPTSKFDNDFDATIDYVRRHPDAPEWFPWTRYRTGTNEGKSWTSHPLVSGEAYIFAVQAMDEAGAVNPVFDEKRNLRRIRASARLAGPTLWASNRYLGTIRSAQKDPLPIIIDLPAGLDMSFCWRADASSYGGIVAGYRYGWDIIDLNDDEQWDVSYTPFPNGQQPTITVCSPNRKFFFGSHSFHVEVIDNNGFKSRVSVVVNIINFTMERNLLVVDDWFEGTPQNTGFAQTRGAVPSDGEHDAFWLDMVSSVADFDPAIDFVQIGGSRGVPELPITKLASYKSVIWSANASYTGIQFSHLADLVRFIDPNKPVTTGKVLPNNVALFMAAGGRVLLCGEQVMTSVIGGGFGGKAIVYPLIFRYELGGDQDGRYDGEGNNVGKYGVGENSFAYAECCLNVIDIAYIDSPNSVRKPPNQPSPVGCPVNLLREHRGVNDGIRSCTPVDVTHKFPRLDLRPEVSTAGRFYAEQTLGLNSDLYNPRYFHRDTACKRTAEIVPRRDCFKPIYILRCRNLDSVVFGAPIAFWTTVFDRPIGSSHTVPARSAVFGFHPVFFEPAQVRKAMQIILHDEWKLPRRVSG